MQLNVYYTTSKISFTIVPSVSSDLFLSCRIRSVLYPCLISGYIPILWFCAISMYSSNVQKVFSITKAISSQCKSEKIFETKLILSIFTSFIPNLNLNAGNLVLVSGVQFGVSRVRYTHFVPGLKQLFGTECWSRFSFFILNKKNISNY